MQVDSRVGITLVGASQSPMEWVDYSEAVAAERVMDSEFLARWELSGGVTRQALCFMDEDANVFALGLDGGELEGDPGQHLYFFVPDPDFVLVAKEEK